jgi:hypothetical protein
MSRNIRRRTAVLLVAASVGLLGAVEAQAGGSRRTDRPAASKVSVANQLQSFARILWQEAGEALDGLMSAPASHHREGHNPPGHQRCGTANGPGIDPDGRFNGNDRNGNNGHGNDC